MPLCTAAGSTPVSCPSDGPAVRRRAIAPLACTVPPPTLASRWRTSAWPLMRHSPVAFRCSTGSRSRSHGPGDVVAEVGVTVHVSVPAGCTRTCPARRCAAPAATARADRAAASRACACGTGCFAHGVTRAVTVARVCRRSASRPALRAARWPACRVTGPLQRRRERQRQLRRAARHRRFEAAFAGSLRAAACRARRRSHRRCRCRRPTASCPPAPRGARRRSCSCRRARRASNAVGRGDPLQLRHLDLIDFHAQRECSSDRRLRPLGLGGRRSSMRSARGAQMVELDRALRQRQRLPCQLARRTTSTFRPSCSHCRCLACKPVAQGALHAFGCERLRARRRAPSAQSSDCCVPVHHHRPAAASTSSSHRSRPAPSASALQCSGEPARIQNVAPMLKCSRSCLRLKP